MRFVALLVAAVIAVVAGIAVLRVSGDGTPATPQTASQQPVATVDILVARQPIEVGTIFADEMIDRQPWPSHLLLDGFITTDSPDANLTGKVARAPFQMNEPIVRSKVANPNDPSFLAAALPPGMRAVTMATDAISGVGGYVFPGDRVDVIITHNIPNDVQSRNNLKIRQLNKPDISEVLVTDARVLAVNVRQAAGKESSSAPSSITLEVSEPDAQALRLGEKVGTLSLALRPLKSGDEQATAPTKSVYLTNVKIFGPQTGGVRIVRGAGAGSDDMGLAADSEQQPEEAPPAAALPPAETLPVITVPEAAAGTQ